MWFVLIAMALAFVAEHISPILISFPWSNCVLF